MLLLAVLSILGLWNADNTIFDFLNVPEGVEKEKVINNILLNCAEVSFIYSNPETAKYAIGLWSDKHALEWVKMYETTILEYNPIENYDMKEEWTDHKNANGDSSHQNTASDETTNKVHGFEENAIVTANVNTSRGTDRITNSYSGTEQATHSARRHGNLGVTTSQKMVADERLIVQFNMVDYITKEFQKEFCVMVY